MVLNTAKAMEGCGVIEVRSHRINNYHDVYSSYIANSPSTNLLHILSSHWCHFIDWWHDFFCKLESLMKRRILEITFWKYFLYRRRKRILFLFELLNLTIPSFTHQPLRGAVTWKINMPVLRDAVLFPLLSLSLLTRDLEVKDVQPLSRNSANVNAPILFSFNS